MSLDTTSSLLRFRVMQLQKKRDAAPAFSEI
jgi:hypothetical protein